MIGADSEELALVRETAKAFAEEHVAPHAQDWDRDGGYPDDILPQLGDLGFMGVLAPESYGGAGGSYAMFAAVLEELARHDAGLALAVEAHNGLCCQHLLLDAHEGLLRRVLPPLTSGAQIGSWCLSEPGSGSDAAALTTRAVRKDDAFILNGSKQFITNGARAGLYVVMARTSGESGPEGVSAFAVERGTPGLIVGKKEEKLGMRSSDTVLLTFENAVVPASNLVGAEGEAFATVKRVLQRGRVMISAISLGLLRGALEEASRYARERRAFGKPIGDFQMIQAKLADMACAYEASRLLLDRAVAMLDGGEYSAYDASVAKLFISEAATKAAMEAIQILGGYGYLREYNVERYMRDAKLCEIGEGTSEIMRILIAKSLGAR